MEKENQKALTLDELAKYNQEVLLPAFDGRIDSLLDSKLNVLKEDLVTKEKFTIFKDKIYTDIDGLSKKLDILLTEKKVREYQEEKEKKLFAIMIKAMKEHSLLSPKELEEIAHLEIF